MQIEKFFRKNALIIIFILNLTLLSSLSFNQINQLQKQPVIQTSHIPIHISNIHNQHSTFTPFLGMFHNSIHKAQRIENIDETFKKFYDMINPHSLIENGFTGKNVKIAILDSGVNAVGWIENLIAKNTTVTGSTLVDDDNGHGTLVGSIISKIATDANLISIKVGNGSGEIKKEWVEEGFQLALDYNVSIIQASLGTNSLEVMNSTLIADIIAKNISIVLSAGNEGPYGSSILSPAIFPETIAVGMTYNKTHMPSVSSSGPRPSGSIGPDLVAPGVGIVGYDHNGNPTNNSGTSFAAPFISGSLALLKEAFPKTSPTALKAALLETANFLNSTSPINQGNGLVDISRAYQLLKSVNINNPLITLAPKRLSSYFTYFGHAVNGVNRTYSISLYSTIDCMLTQINTSQTFPYINTTSDNVTQEFPIEISVLSQEISMGLNYIDLSLNIPKGLSMAKREANVTFHFSNGSFTYPSINLTITIENRYPGGNILFYQGYDNDSYIPDGPTGSFSLLQNFLEGYYGMITTGAIRSTGLININGPLVQTEEIGITKQDLENQDILVLADIEFSLTDQEIDIIQDWVSEGHSLLVLSFPSRMIHGWETLSNQVTINKLLKKYGLSIEDDNTNLSRFEWGSTTISEPIFEEKGWKFDYTGTSVRVSTEKGSKVLATAINQKSESQDETPIAGYWMDSETKGKVVVFGGELPFNDEGINFNRNNLAVITRIFRWMIQDQQISLDILLTSTPTAGGSTKIQVTFNDPGFDDNHFNGTIIEANQSFSQVNFKKSSNMYLGSWNPLIAGNAFLWLNLEIEGKAATNGLYIIEIVGSSSPDVFFLMLFGSIIIIGVAFYLMTSRKSKTLSPIEQRVAYQLQKQKQSPQHAGLQTLERCPQCLTPRYTDESKYCFQCGKEL